MRLSFVHAAIAALAMLAPQVQADTMYKCVDPDGKIAYGSQPCAGKAKEAKTKSVPAPLDGEDLAALSLQQKEKMRLINENYATRKQAEQRAEDYERQQAALRAAQPKPPTKAQLADAEKAKRDESDRLRHLRRMNCERRHGRNSPGC